MHAVGQASSQQRPPYSYARSSVLGTACPPQWLPLLLAAAVPPSASPSPPPMPPSSPPSSPPPPSPPASPPSSQYTFALGTFASEPSDVSLGCADLDKLLETDDTSVLASAVDMCFDANFSCDHAKPFVGMATIEGIMYSISPEDGGAIHSKAQMTVQLEGSDSKLSALIPLSQRSRPKIDHPVPIVGCLVSVNTASNASNINNASNASNVSTGGGDRFVLSWADIRCRSSTTNDPTTNYSFPAECDGGNQVNVPIENAEAAISFVGSLTAQQAPPSGSQAIESYIGDPVNDYVKGKRKIIVVLISYHNENNALDSWNFGGSRGGNGRYNPNDPRGWADEVVRTHSSSAVSAPLPANTCDSCVPYR